MTRVRALVPTLETIVGQPLELDRNVQDASFFTEVACHQEANQPGIGRILEPILAVRFSSFGELFTVASAMDVAPSIVSRVIAAVSRADFVYVPADELSEPYTGRNPALVGTSWWIRFFDYL